MLHVYPFAAIRPSAAYAAEIASLPYDVYSLSEAVAEIARHPLSFLRVERSAALLPDIDEYDPRVHTQAQAVLAADLAAGIYLRDDQPGMYIYRLSWQGNVRTGLVAAVGADDFRKGVILRHENTRMVKLADRIEHIRTVQAQTGPVLLMHRSHQKLKELVAGIAAKEPTLYDFTTDDDVRHQVWKVSPEQGLSVQAFYSELADAYIADGHHRLQAALDLDCASVLCMLVASDEMHLQAYHRLVADLNGWSSANFLAELAQFFDVREVLPRTESSTGELTGQRGCFGLYLKGRWYLLSLDEKNRPNDVLAALDVSILQDKVLAPLLGIDDPRSSKRIVFIGGDQPLADIEKRVAALGGAEGTKEALAFVLHPLAINEMLAVADAGGLMPPKSTWFAPKPRSGLLVRPL
ncbi:MAG: DUF1015 domain-containing protein [Actinomycetia bacterium]|nr:DUF1015 domain-containing protein [Actinomycetes bacterium]